MRNLRKPSEKLHIDEGKTLDTGANGIIVYNLDGEPIRIHVGIDNFLYVNNIPFGVQGMPPAPHAFSHAINGDDQITPNMIGAINVDMLADVPTPNKIPLLNDEGILPPEFIAEQVTPSLHVDSHKTGGTDELKATDIGAVANNDPRLADDRTPLLHKNSHSITGKDRILPTDIGAVGIDDIRLTDTRVPKKHAKTHALNGADPITWQDVGSVDGDLFTNFQRIPHGYPQLNDLGHIDINLLPTGLAPGVHAQTHELGGNDEISLDGTQIKTGVIDIARIPQGALEKLVRVQTINNMLALTKAQVQNGDTVQVLDTLLMYIVVNDERLDLLDSYVEYSAGLASRVNWTGVIDKPELFKPMQHASATAEYGLATNAEYGHVKTSDIANENGESAEAFTSKGAFALQQDISANSQGIINLSESITDIRNIIEGEGGLQSQIESNDDDIDTLNTELANTNEQVVDLSNKLEKYDKTNTIEIHLTNKGMFYATEGTLEIQGFIPNTTGSATLDTIVMNVQGLEQKVLVLNDVATDGIAETSHAITPEELAESYSFKGMSKLDEIEGYWGFWVGINDSANANRYDIRFKADESNTYLEIDSVNGGAISTANGILNGVDNPIIVNAFDWFTWELRFVENIAHIFINGLDTGITANKVSASVSNNSFVVSSMSTGQNRHKTYHSYFGIDIPVSKVVKTLVQADFVGYDEVAIVTPDEIVDVEIVMNGNIAGRHYGDLITFFLRHTGELKITGNQNFTFNDTQEYIRQCEDKTKISFNNFYNNNNKYYLGLDTKPFITSNNIATLEVAQEENKGSYLKYSTK